MLRKGVYPYDFMDDFDKFDLEKLPSRESFFSLLSNEGILESDYQQAHKVWKLFNMKNMGDYHDLYLKTDVLLLADVFESFRDTSLENYKLDPCHYYTAPGMAWDAALRLTKVELDLITDQDMYLMFEKGIRGGISTITHRHAVANNPYLPNEKYDPTKEKSYIIYLDANNLYGWGMVQKMPTGNLKWEDLAIWSLEHILCINIEGDKGFCLEVDLEYPNELHNKHNDYPLAPENVIITEDMLTEYQKELAQKLEVNLSTKTGKLVPNLRDKFNYVVDIRNL